MKTVKTQLDRKKIRTEEMMNRLHQCKTSKTVDKLKALLTQTVPF